MPRRLSYKEFEAIAIAEFSCEIQEGEVRHLKRRQKMDLIFREVKENLNF